jgi:hypothetical protein
LILRRAKINSNPLQGVARRASQHDTTSLEMIGAIGHFQAPGQALFDQSRAS